MKSYKNSLLTISWALLWGGAFLSCTSDDEDKPIEPSVSNNVTVKPRLLKWAFESNNNPYQILETAKCELVDDSILICRVRNIMPNKILIASYEYEGNSILIDGAKGYSGVTECDYKTPVDVFVFSGAEKKKYTLYVHSFTGLPVVWIDTEDRKEIKSKDEYIRANFRIDENVITRGPGDVFEDSVNIKGRGNSTWNAPKKPFTLKFDKKVSLLGEEKDKSWVLLANYYDMTMLRNQTAFYMSQISNLDYTPKSHFVEVILNGRYNGTYQLCEKLKIAKHRVDVGDDGFLMEMDNRAISEGEPYFSVAHLPYVVNVKDPDVTIGDELFNYAKTYLNEADSALFSDDFMDPDKGWQ